MKALDEKALDRAWEAFGNTPIDIHGDTDDEQRKCLANGIRAYLTVLSQSPVGELVKELRDLRYLALSAADEPNKCQPADVILRGIHALLSLQAENERLNRELDEAVNWNDLVDRHGLDQFDDIAEAWLAMEPIQRVHNAVTSVFSKWANDELMTRFKQHMSDALQMAFVEGCMCGVRAAEAKARTENSAAESKAEGFVMVPVERRAEELKEWLLKNAPFVFKEQAHLDAGSRERIYWHYGYYVALKDTLAAAPSDKVVAVPVIGKSQG